MVDVKKCKKAIQLIGKIKKYKTVPNSVIAGGTHGTVLICKEYKTQRKVALKKIESTEAEKTGIQVHALREIGAYKSIQLHPNILQMFDVISQDTETFIVLEFMEESLKRYMKRIDLTNKQLLSFKKQLSNGLAYCHSMGFMHRDIKPDNILIKNDILKICDFGLAKMYSRNPNQSHTLEVVTLWYKSLELLLGNSYYDEKIDIWSLGCVFAEMDMSRKKENFYLFPGHCEIDMIFMILTKFGKPNETTMQVISLYEWYNKDIFDMNISKYTELSGTIYEKIFTYNISKRSSAAEILMLLHTDLPNIFPD